jgi:hypothetical protein
VQYLHCTFIVRYVPFSYKFQKCVVRCVAVLFCPVLPYPAMLHSHSRTVLHCTELHYTVLHFTALTLHYTAYCTCLHSSYFIPAYTVRVVSDFCFTVSLTAFDIQFLSSVLGSSIAVFAPYTIHLANSALLYSSQRPFTLL